MKSLNRLIVRFILTLKDFFYISVIVVLLGVIYEDRLSIQRMQYPKWVEYEGYRIFREGVLMVTPVDYAQYYDIEGERWSIEINYYGQIMTFYNKTRKDAQADYDFFCMLIDLNQYKEEQNEKRY